MTIKDVAEREQISERQAQRYCREGFKGHVLPSVMVGKARSISDADYRQWRIDCGWETAQTAEVATPLRPVRSQESWERLAEPAPPVAAYPPWPMPADPVHGVLTNAPHPRSSNHPHPLACQAYLQNEARKLEQKYRGNPDAEN